MSRHLISLTALGCAVYAIFHFDLVASAFEQLGQAPLVSIPKAREPRAFTRRIVAVGDLHGDFANARKVLQFSGVINDKGDWSGDVDVFAQTGDIIDRGADTIKLFAYMDTLRAQAEASGAIMLSHLGNHEWMNAIGDWRYVYPSDLETFESIEARQEMLSTGTIGRSWARNYTTASRLPLHPSMGPPNTPYPLPAGNAGPLSHAAVSFVHGGLAPSYSNLTPFPSRINELSDSLLRKVQRRVQPEPHPPGPYVGLPSDATREEEELYATNGPLWYRGWAQDPDAVACKQVDIVLNKTGTRRMIMGHTPDFHNITVRCGGKIIIIDTGISKAYGGVLSALSITYTLEPVGNAANPDEQEWNELEFVTALYEDKHEIVSEESRRIVGRFHL